MDEKSDDMSCQLCDKYNSCKLHDGTNRKPEYRDCKGNLKEEHKCEEASMKVRCDNHTNPTTMIMTTGGAVNGVHVSKWECPDCFNTIIINI